jgi:hypothetical protein
MPAGRSRSSQSLDVDLGLETDETGLPLPSTSVRPADAAVRLARACFAGRLASFLAAMV